jgi:hypothetical protein
MHSIDHVILAVKATARRMGRCRALNTKITMIPATPTGSESPMLTSPRHFGGILRMPGNPNIRDRLKCS